MLSGISNGSSAHDRGHLQSPPVILPDQGHTLSWYGMWSGIGALWRFQDGRPTGKLISRPFSEMVSTDRNSKPPTFIGSWGSVFKYPNADDHSSAGAGARPTVRGSVSAGIYWNL
jgi:hypothetical protein